MCTHPTAAGDMGSLSTAEVAIHKGFFSSPPSLYCRCRDTGYVHVREVSMAQCMRDDSEYAACTVARPVRVCPMGTRLAARECGVCGGGIASDAAAVRVRALEQPPGYYFRF